MKTTTFGGSHLPEEFEREWMSHAHARGVSDHYDIKHVEQRFGLWTITLRANDKVIGVRKAEDIKGAAAELFRQAWPIL